jgi:ribosomal protein S5
VIADICDCIGLDGVGGKVLGSRNVGNVIHATFAGTDAGLSSPPAAPRAHGHVSSAALAAQRTPRDVARERGLRVVDLSTAFEQREQASRGKHT